MKCSKILDAAFELWGQSNVRACGYGTIGIPPLLKYSFLSPVREPLFSSAASNKEIAKALWIRERWHFKLLSLISSWSTLSFSLVHFSSPFLLKEFCLFSVFKQCVNLLRFGNRIMYMLQFYFPGTVWNMTSIFCTLICINFFMLNEQKMSLWNRWMKFSIAADLFLAHLEMAVERKPRLLDFVLLKSAVDLLSSFGVRWGSALSS